MKKVSLLRYASVGMASLALAGVAAASTVTVGTTGPNSSNNAQVNNTSTWTSRVSNTLHVDNDNDQHARTGDANVSGNTNGGSATSGVAKVATNVANVVNSAINVKHWFGVLVINVFGDWFGSVNQNTAAGDLPAAPQGPSSNSGAAQLAAVAATAHGAGVGFGNSAAAVTQTAASAANATAGTVLAAATQVPTTVASLAHKGAANLILFGSAFALLLAGALFSLERKFRRS